MAFDYCQNFHFRSISCEQIDEIWSNFAYALTITSFRLGLLHIKFCKLTKQLWPLAVVEISFPLNILWMKWWNLIEFCICFDTDQIYAGIYMRQFSQIYNTVMALGYCQISFPLNILGTNRWNLNKPSIALMTRQGSDCHVPILANFQHSYGP